MRTRRCFFATTLLLLIAPTLALADGPEASSTHGSFDRAQCRYARYDGRVGVSDDEVRKMLRCAEDRWPVSGGVPKLFSVVSCESHFQEGAYNASSGAGGLFQFLASTWDGLRSRSRHLGRRLDLSWSRFNARASAVLGTRVIHQSGYGPWSAGACA